MRCSVCEHNMFMLKNRNKLFIIVKLLHGWKPAPMIIVIFGCLSLPKIRISSRNWFLIVPSDSDLNDFWRDKNSIKIDCSIYWHCWQSSRQTLEFGLLAIPVILKAKVHKFQVHGNFMLMLVEKKVENRYTRYIIHVPLIDIMTGNPQQTTRCVRANLK
jgi:hypothetical protein